MAEFTVDLSRDIVHVKVKPEDRWDPTELVISGAGTTVRLQVTDDDLAEIAETIRTHLERVRYHETPDQQRILNAELDAAIENGVA
jgi:putative alpha-1,2-mannosidase